MSLIQEALRRQNEDGEGPPGQPPGPAQEPAGALPASDSASKAPSKLTLKHASLSEQDEQAAHVEHLHDLYDTPPPDEGDRRTKLIMLIGGGVMAVLLLACVGGGVWYFFVRPKPQTPVADIKPVPVAPAVTATSNAAPAASGAVAETASPVTTNVIAVLPEKKEAAADISMAPPVPETNAAEALPPVDTKPSWPTLTLSGTMGRGAKSTALINKQMVRNGDLVEGVTVISIQQDSVELEFNGERQTIKGGGTTK